MIELDSITTLLPTPTLTCEKHNSESIEFGCTNIYCSKNPLLCSSCLFDNQHCLHGSSIVGFDDFLSNVALQIGNNYGLNSNIRGCLEEGLKGGEFVGESSKGHLASMAKHINSQKAILEEFVEIVLNTLKEDLMKVVRSQQDALDTWLLSYEANCELVSSEFNRLFGLSLSFKFASNEEWLKGKLLSLENSKALTFLRKLKSSLSGHFELAEDIDGKAEEISSKLADLEKVNVPYFKGFTTFTDVSSIFSHTLNTFISDNLTICPLSSLSSPFKCNIDSMSNSNSRLKKSISNGFFSNRQIMKMRSSYEPFDGNRLQELADGELADYHFKFNFDEVPSSFCLINSSMVALSFKTGFFRLLCTQDKRILSTIAIGDCKHQIHVLKAFSHVEFDVGLIVIGETRINVLGLRMEPHELTVIEEIEVGVVMGFADLEDSAHIIYSTSNELLIIHNFSTKENKTLKISPSPSTCSNLIFFPSIPSLLGLTQDSFLTVYTLSRHLPIHSISHEKTLMLEATKEARSMELISERSCVIALGFDNCIRLLDLNKNSLIHEISFEDQLIGFTVEIEELRDGSFNTLILPQFNSPHDHSDLQCILLSTSISRKSSSHLTFKLSSPPSMQPSRYESLRILNEPENLMISILDCERSLLLITFQ